MGVLLLLLAGVSFRGSDSVAATAPTVIYRVNAGGPALTGSPAWSTDTAAAPYAHVNAAATGNTTYSVTNAIDLSHPSVPAGTPAALFQAERWDGAAAPELEWDFPVTPGSYEVRLYFAEIFSGTQAIGARVFDVSIEGQLVLDNFDSFAAVGGYKGIVKSFTVTSDANLDVDFGHVVENPAVKGIEILAPAAAATSNQLGATPANADFGAVVVDQTQTKQIQLTNLGGAGDPAIVVDTTSITGAGAAHFGDSFDDAGDVTLAPGASTTLTASFKPTSVGAKSATLDVAHSGTNSLLAIPLAGSGGSTVPVGFGKSLLSSETSQQATSLQFGPDGRLYVAQQDGYIKAYTVVRNGPNSYAVTGTETISAIRSIQNHNDDGTLNLTINDRIITGILAVGTAANPKIYVTSSDPRIGGGGSGTDLGLDTNSSMLSRLAWTGSSWHKVDLVRGLPRSEENHSANGMQLDAATNTLYVTQGGNTNMGATSNNFALLPEFALSAAILAVDLTAIGDTTYDLPTLDDDSRGGTADFNDPFGGNNGKNQAKRVPGGPVQVYAPGFRNPYDLLITQSGRMYTIDNGGNAGWGDVPVNEGPAGNCTSAVKEPGTTQADTLHLITGPGYYGGHPNPTRANTANTFNANGQSPVPSGNPVECDFRYPGMEQGSLTSFAASTNGLAEYTASNFGEAMKGDLLTASFNNAIYRIKLDSTGTNADATVLFASVGSIPLDLVAQGDAGPFPGTVWAADVANGSITVFEPNDYHTAAPPCGGQPSDTLDEDGDGFTNADEIANRTNPCSAGDVPPDWDGDKLSNLRDPDDDNDGQPDTSDPFAIDAKNGTATTLPARFTWDNDAPQAGGLLNLGFTGLMTNGVSNYESLFDPAKMTAGGAAGVTTVDNVAEGDALGASNTQHYGFQFGVKAPATGPFTAHTRILTPFAGLTPQGSQSMGVFVGTGTQDDYVKVVVAANGGGGGVQFVKEVAGAATSRPQANVALPGPSSIDLYLTVDPVAKTVQPSYTIGAAGTRVNLGGAEPIPAAWLTSPTALAVGIISTSAGPAPEFPATWDLIEVEPDLLSGKWETRAGSGFSRQEVSYVQAGGKFYLAGGSTRHEAYDPTANTWSDAAQLPTFLDHIQGVELNGLIYYIGGLSSWPGPHTDTVSIYNPATNTLSTGARMPRGRGAGGVAVYKGKIYYAGGLHNSVAVPWLDVYDPASNTWTALPDMPRARDHFHAAVVGDRLYAIGGRNRDIDATTGANDAYDFTTGAWVSGLAPLPTPRGGFAAAVLGDEVLVIGGEGGGKTFDIVEAYSVKTNAWRTLAPMPTARHGIQAAVCNDGVYIAAGGKTQGGGTPSNVHEVFFLDEPKPCFATDTAPPTVTQTTPATGASAVAASTNVEATFSEAMAAASITASTFTLQKQGAAGPVAAAVTYDSTAKKAVLNPSADLEAGASYTATVKGGAGGVTDAAGNALVADKVWSFTVAAASPPQQQGLKGDYFNNQNLTALVLTRVDPTVNFNWGTGSPHASIGPDTFSVRWTGEVKSDHSQTYTFSTVSNDGVRLWIGGQLLIDNWTAHAATENTGTITLQAGQWYSLKLEYFEGTGTAVISLSYASASTPKQIIPSDHLRAAGAVP